MRTQQEINKEWSDNSENYSAIIDDELNSFRAEAWRRKILEQVASGKKLKILDTGCGQPSVSKYKTGFVLRQSGTQEAPWEKSDYCALIDDSAARVNTALFRGGWFDSLTMLWNDIQAGKSEEKQREQQNDFPNPGGCLSLEFSLMPGEEKTIPVICCWYVPESSLRIARAEDDGAEEEVPLWKKKRYSPWYAGRFASIEELCAYLVQTRARLLEASQKFSQAFFSSTPENKDISPF